MKKRMILIVGCIVLTAMIFRIVGTVQAAKTTTSTSTTISQSIKEKQSQIDKMEKEKSNMKKNLSDVQAIKKNLEAKKSDLAKYIEVQK